MKLKRVKKVLLTVLLLGMTAAQGVPVQAASERLPSGIAYEEIGAEIERFVSEHEDTTAGMAVRVFEQDETVYANCFGYADREAGLAVEQDSVLEWGSASKLLVWVSVMQLWEQGRIDLNADIREYLPEGFLTNLNYETPVTMLNLMNHNAGFQESYAEIMVKEHEAVRTLEDALKAHEPEQIYEPGTITAYSNWGAALAALVVERISGESFDAYVRQHIFEPLGMENSALSADLSDNIRVQEKRKELQCYTAEGTLIPDCFYYILLYPTGMCTSTPGDFEIFGKALLNEESPLFQKKETWKTLFTPTAFWGDSEMPSVYHGFLVFPYAVEVVGHGGNTEGSSSVLLLDLQNGIGAVVMTNQAGETVYNNEMMELIFGRFSAQDYFGIQRSTPEGIYRMARTVRVGPFKIMSYFELFDKVEQDDVWITGTNGDAEKLCFIGTDAVRVSGLQFVLETALLFLWIAAAVFSAVSLLVKTVRWIIRICRKKQNIIPLGKWSALAAVEQVMAVLFMAAVGDKAGSYALAKSYAWMFAAFGILAIAMLLFGGYGAVMLWRTESSKKRKLYNLLTVILLVGTAANIGYWNLFMFWKF